MKEKIKILKELFLENKWKCFLFAGLDLLCFWTIWLIDDKKAEALTALVLLFTALLFIGFFSVLYWKYWRKKEYLENLLESGEIWEKSVDDKMLSSHEIYLIEELGKQLQNSKNREKRTKRLYRDMGT